MPRRRPLRNNTMPKDDHEFSSLFEDDTLDDKSKDLEELFNINDQQGFEKIKEEKPAAPAAPLQPSAARKKRTSEDFAPDMDALFIAAQSPFITEGLKCLTLKDFSADTYGIYTEAVKGIEVYIKILKRKPKNYFKMSEAIKCDADCKEIETVALQLYRAKHYDFPQTDGQMLRAYEMLRNRLRIGHNKAMVSTSIVVLKKYYLLSGMIDQAKIDDLMRGNDGNFKDDIVKFRQHFNIAMQLIKIGDYEIGKGLKGRDLNTFIIRSSRLLAYYFLSIGDSKTEEYYQRIYDNFKKYLITL